MSGLRSIKGKWKTPSSQSLSLPHIAMSATPEFLPKKNEKSELDPTPARTPNGSFAEGEFTDGRDDDEEEVIVGWRPWMAAAAGASCVFSGYYTGLLLGNTSGFMVASFDSPELATWIANEYTIVTAAIAGLIGACSDLVGRKWVLIGGITLALIGSILLACAQNMAMVLVGAGFQSGLFINQGNFFSIPAEVLPRRYRGLGQTFAVSAGAAGVLIGFTFSGLTIQYNTGGLGWRST